MTVGHPFTLSCFHLGTSFPASNTPSFLPPLPKLLYWVSLLQSVTVSSFSLSLVTLTLLKVVRYSVEFFATWVCVMWSSNEMVKVTNVGSNILEVRSPFYYIKAGDTYLTFCCYFWDEVSPCSPGWLGSHDPPGLMSQSARVLRLFQASTGDALPYLSKEVPWNLVEFLTLLPFLPPSTFLFFLSFLFFLLNVSLFYSRI